MDKLRIKGKLVYHINNVHKRLGNEATIELTPDELCKQLNKQELGTLYRITLQYFLDLG